MHATLSSSALAGIDAFRVVVIVKVGGLKLVEPKTGCCPHWVRNLLNRFRRSRSALQVLQRESSPVYFAYDASSRYYAHLMQSTYTIIRL